MYICIYVSALGWSIWGYDPALVTFLYSSPPGVLVQLTRIASAIWFLYASWTTFRSNPQNRKFYGLFAAVFFVSQGNIYKTEREMERGDVFCFY